MAAPEPLQPRQKNVFVLCFDGTGNKFSGTDADSNILKLYRMLDRTDATMYTFYQPGIGTYITSHSMQTTSTLGRLRSWYLKAKDSAIGSSFAEHVMGGYTFLMRYYSCEDDLYFFGFSRGAYTARFLAEMLDHIGLLSAGNEELIRFAWKTYAKWAARTNDGSDKATRDEEAQYEFMRGFRETFSRPVRRIRFLGLFDTVNSVPRFESAWMQRSRFPYTARSSAKVIRHAVSIDERRAKFRQDLITSSHAPREDQPSKPIRRYDADVPSPDHDDDDADPSGRADGVQVNGFSPQSERDGRPRHDGPRIEVSTPRDERSLSPNAALIPPAETLSSLGLRPLQSKQSEESLAGPMETPSMEHLQSKNHGLHRARRTRRRWSEDKRPQDIQEVWFSGGHGDVGGGWSKVTADEQMLSHTPLVWMVHEAERAGLNFDPNKVADRSCLPDRVDEYGERFEDEAVRDQFLQTLEASYTKGIVHDCLDVGGGLPTGTVLFWKMMEYLPFRRMDLENGHWRAIRWPLPMGETRDIPNEAQIHVSVIRRMQADPKYRPGNLIVGGGGRGVRKAPKKYGIGEWVPHMWDGDHVKQTYVRKAAPGTKVKKVKA